MIRVANLQARRGVQNPRRDQISNKKLSATPNETVFITDVTQRSTH